MKIASDEPTPLNNNGDEVEDDYYNCCLNRKKGMHAKYGHS